MRRPLVDSIDDNILAEDVILTARREALNQAVAMEVERGGPFSTFSVLRKAAEFEEWLLRGLNE